MEIKQVNNENKGYFLAQENGREAGRMTYSWAGQDKIIIDHTEVSSDFSGKGVGKKMVNAAVQFARKEAIKILPLCPFAKKVMDKDVSLQDVMF